MDFEQWLLSFMKTVREEDAELLPALLIIHGYTTPDDMLEAPRKWLETQCEVFVDADNFQIFRHAKSDRYFLDDFEDPSSILTQMELIGLEDVPLDTFDIEDIDLEKYENAIYCGEVANSSHNDSNGRAVTAIGWFKYK